MFSRRNPAKLAMALRCAVLALLLPVAACDPFGGASQSAVPDEVRQDPPAGQGEDPNEYAAPPVEDDGDKVQSEGEGDSVDVPEDDLPRIQWDGASFERDFDIVYVRYPRRGDAEFIMMPDGETPYTIEPGADLMLLHPDGTEDILVDCDETSSVQDPVISYDGKWVIYAKYVGMIAGRSPIYQPADSFLFKMRLDEEKGAREEIQLTDGSTDLAIDKTAFANASDLAEFRKYFGIRDLGPCPLPDGRILFTSNREALVAFEPEAMLMLGAVRASTVSQLCTIDDHDGSVPNADFQVLSHGTLRMAQHPTVLRDGRILFTNWDNAALNSSYGVATLYTCHPDGMYLEQYLMPANLRKKVDHFITELSSGKTIVCTYYPRGGSWGYGVFYRHSSNQADPKFKFGGYPAERDERIYSRVGTVNITPHTTAGDTRATNLSGRYSTPSAAPNDALLFSYSPGPVQHRPIDGTSGIPFIDAGLYAIAGAGVAVVSDPQAISLIKNDPAYNEMWPRAVVPYSRIHGVAAPARVPAKPKYGPSTDPVAEAGAPVGFTGTSSMTNRESKTYANDQFNAKHSQDKVAGGWVVQGADVGNVKNEDLYAVRLIQVVPDRFHSTNSTTPLERSIPLLNDGRVKTHVKGYHSQAGGENWKILGEFPVVGDAAKQGTNQSKPDPDGQPDTSWLAKVPANTPFFIQGIDKYGMTLFTEQTWRHVNPGRTVANCGGCHAHSIAPVPLRGKRADAKAYVPWDLVDRTPMIRTSSQGVATTVELPSRVTSIEFRRDVLPLLKGGNRCGSCHTSSGSAAPASVASVSPVLSMFDSTLTGFAADVRTYRAVASDSKQEFAYGVTIPEGEDHFFFPQMSRYVRAIQARSSLLTWKIYGRRTDGWSNESFPDPKILFSEDLDFELGKCDAPNRLTAAEKGIITRWIDLGCPIDLDRTRQRYTQDNELPILTAEVTADSGALAFRVGVLDMMSGIDAESLRVKITAPDGTVLEYGLADVEYDPENHIVTFATGASISPNSIGAESPLLVEIAVKDRTGNEQRLSFRAKSIPAKY